MSDGAKYIVNQRDDLSHWHYGFDDGLRRHPTTWTDSVAWTHCICFAAAAKAVEPLLDQIEHLNTSIRQKDREIAELKRRLHGPHIEGTIDVL